MAEKVCTKCNTVYPATQEYFSACKHTVDQLQSWCKVCVRKNNRAYMQSEKGRAVFGNYKKSEGGRAANRKGHQKYYNTINGRLRYVFSGIKQRCTNFDHAAYKNYGGRGIKCLFTSDEFVDYVMNVLKVDPHGLQVDRINNDGHYEKGNIRFVTAKENCNNRRNSYG